MGRLLAVDVGNSQIVAGLFAEAELAHSWRFSTRRDMTADELYSLLAPLLAQAKSPVEDSIVASVVPVLTEQVCSCLAHITGRQPLQVVPGVKTGLKIRTDHPHELGADRIVNAVAGLSLFTGPLVIVDFGTATTLDVVTADGEYLGGVIAPGPEVGADALFSRAARLPRVDLSVPERVVGRNSVDSVRSGLMYGHAAMIDGLIERIHAEVGGKIQVIATGGLSSLIGPLLRRIDRIAPDLTLQGLRMIYDRNRS